MHSFRTPAAFFAAVIVMVSIASRSSHSQTTDVENEAAHGAVNIQEAHGVTGISQVRPASVRVVQISELPQVGPGTTASRAASRAMQKSSAVTGPSLVLQSFQGPVGNNPPDPAIAVGPTQVISTVNSTMTIYDKKGTVLSSTPIAVFMFQPAAAVWDTHLYYDNHSGHFFVVCVTGDQSTTGAILLAVSATSDARGAWYLYTLKEAKNAWLDFPAPTVTSNALVLSFQDIPAAGSTQKGICATEVIGLPELLSGNQNLKITRFDSVFGQPGQCNYAYPVINYEPGNIAYLLAPNTPAGSGASLALGRIDTSGTPVLDVSTIPVPNFNFVQGTVPQKGSSTGLYTGGPGIDGTALRNGSLWCTHTVAESDGTAAVRWYELDPLAKIVKQVGDVSGVGNAWLGALAVLPDNQVDLIYTTSSANDYASAGYAHRSAADPPNTMPITGVYQPGSGVYTGTRWGDFFEAWSDPDGQSAWGIAEYMGASSYGTAIVQLASSSGVSVAPSLAISVSPTIAAVNAGQSANFAISVTAQNAQAISFSCSGLPPGAACSFNPASLNGSGAAQLTIATASTSGALISPGRFALGTFALVLGMTLIPGLRRRTRLLGLLLVICALIAFVACGGVSRSSNPQPGPNQPPPTGTAPPPTTPPPPPATSPTPPVSPPAAPQSFAVIVTATGTPAKASATIALTVK